MDPFSTAMSQSMLLPAAVMWAVALPVMAGQSGNAGYQAFLDQGPGNGVGAFNIGATAMDDYKIHVSVP